ncbi:MAG: molybdopterin-dependent oxidoreductase [Chloroflexia bacterium]
MVVRGIGPYRVMAGVGAGAGAALGMMGVMGVLRLLVSFPTIPELMINPIVRLLGGQAFSDALDRLYYAGRPLLFVLILEGTLLLGALLGLGYAWLARPDVATGRRLRLFEAPQGGVLFGLVIGVLLSTVFLPVLGQDVFASHPLGIYAPSPLPLWAGLMLEGLVFGLLLVYLLPSVSPAVEAGHGASAVALPPGAGGVDRRGFLRIAGGTLMALLAGVGLVIVGARQNQGNVTISPNEAGGDSADAAQEADGSGGAGGPGTPGAVATDTSEPLPTPTDAPATATPQATDVPTAQAEPSPTRAEAPGEAPTATVEPAATNTMAPADTPTPLDTPTPVSTATPLNTTTPTVAVPVIKVSENTPTEAFYHVSKNFFDPSPSTDGWQLEFKGLVNKPYALTYKELTALPAVKVTTGMMCISNPTGGGLIGNTTWKGVRLGDLIKRASPQAGVVDVVMRAVDDYADSIPYKKALDPDVMLVWEMGGKALTSQHGFPARVLVPGIYGMKHVKWITSVELVSYDFKGYWQDPSQGWSDPAPVNTMSRIDYPAEGNLGLKPQDISGVAFAGDRSISKVEVSTDGGKSWNAAYLKPPRSGTSWVVWGYRWTPPGPGRYTVKVRATDGNGKVQTAKVADAYPNGATGYHAVTYKVKG